MHEHGVTYLAAPWTGQKTGAFLDQRENRHRIGVLARGRALDCFAYHGSFALHLAERADTVLAIDASAAALERARENAARNGRTNIEFLEADAFDALRALERNGERFDTIVVDPPAFAKNRHSLAAALRGYHEINLRALRLLAPGGLMLSASCSFHLGKSRFLEMLEHAAADSGRRIALREICVQPPITPRSSRSPRRVSQGRHPRGDGLTADARATRTTQHCDWRDAPRRTAGGRDLATVEPRNTASAGSADSSTYCARPARCGG